MEYLIPAEEAVAQIEIKRSRFLMTVRPITSADAMKQFVCQKREEHPKARHHCWAMIAGAPSDSRFYGFSDDGEPSGTAGKPMFTVLQYSGLGQVGVVVTRYFGGIKLGTGGLVKAYTEATKVGIEALATRPYSATVVLKVVIPYAQEPLLRHLLAQLKPTKVEFDHGSEVVVSVTVTERNQPSVVESLKSQLGYNTKILP